MKKTKTQSILSFFHLPLWLTILLAIVFILRIPSFLEPFSYGDEMIYLTLGEAIRRGLTLYRDIHDNKPPLLYFIAAVAGNVFWFRVILTAWMMATVAIFWKLTRALFPKEKLIQKAATITFAILTSLPLFEGQIPNAELFMIGPIILAFYLLLSKPLKIPFLLASGVLISLATLFKVPAAFDIGAIIFLWLVLLKYSKKSVTGLLFNSLVLFAGFLLPIVATLIWYYLKGALPEYFEAAFLQNVGYLSSWRPSTSTDSFLIRNAPLIHRGLILSLGLLILSYFRKKLSTAFIFSSAWLLFSLFAVTLSERPYPHYLIQSLPAVSLLIGTLFAKKNIEQVLVIIPLSLFALVPVYFNFYHYPTLPYFERFFSLTLGSITKEEYYRRFDNKVVRNYKIAHFISTTSNQEDPVFVWGDSSNIYALSRRLPPFKYIATYHINDFSTKDDVLNMLSSQKPVIVVTLPEAPEFPELFHFLSDNYIQISSIDGAMLWKLANPTFLRSTK